MTIQKILFLFSILFWKQKTEFEFFILNSKWLHALSHSKPKLHIERSNDKCISLLIMGEKTSKELPVGVFKPFF